MAEARQGSSGGQPPPHAEPADLRGQILQLDAADARIAREDSVCPTILKL
jgi:hypothetical protein